MRDREERERFLTVLRVQIYSASPTLWERLEEITHCACGALLVAGKCIRCEEDRD